MDKTRHLSLETMETLLQGSLPPGAAADLQAHIADCSRCRQAFEELSAFNDAWGTWSADAHGRALGEYPPDRRKHLYAATAEGLKDIFPHGLTPLQRKRFESWRRQAFESETDAAGVAEDEAQLTLLAAAPAFVGAVRGEVGTAFGVGVDEETGRGALIKVTAHVGDALLDSGNVTLVGAQVERQVHKGVEYQLTAPLSLLKKKLVKRFETIPALAALSLAKREVHVEVDLPQYLFRSESLLLAVIVAVVKAATGSDSGERFVYSAEVGMDGALRRVGHLDDKAKVIAQHEGYRWVVAEDSLEQLAPEMPADATGRIDAFGGIAPLLRHLGIPEGTGATPAIQQPGKEKARRGPGWMTLAAAFSGITLVLALILASRRFFVLGDLAMVWHLSEPSTGVPVLAQFAKWGLGFAAIFGLVAAGVAFSSRQSSKRPVGAGGFPGLALVLLAVYAVLNLQQFTTAVERSESDYSRYEKVEYLRYSKPLSGLTSSLPDYRYLEFSRLASQTGAAELEKAVEIGVATNTSAPTFGDTFVQVVVILMQKVDSAGLAAQALNAYVAYVDTLAHRPHARSLVADTLTAAEDLMRRYHLEQVLYQGQPYGDRLQDFSSSYQL